MLDIIVKSEKGSIIKSMSDKNNYLIQIFDKFSTDFNIRKLKNIDPYNDIIFKNNEVLKICISDIEYLKSRAINDGERAALDCLEELFKIALEEKLCYVKFLGD